MSTYEIYSKGGKATSFDGTEIDLMNYYPYLITTDAFDTDDLIVLVNDMLVKFRAHFNSGPGVHSTIDGGNIMSIDLLAPATNYGEAFGVIRALYNIISSHAARDDIHLAPDTSFASLPGMPYHEYVPQLVAYINALKAAFNDHLANNDVHSTPDAVNVVSTTDAVDNAFHWGMAKVTLHVTAFDQFNIDGKSWEYKFSLYMGNSGDLSIIGTPQLIFSSGTPGSSAWSVSVVTSLRDLIVNITGENGKTIEWTGRLEFDMQFLF